MTVEEAEKAEVEDYERERHVKVTPPNVTTQPPPLRHNGLELKI